MSFELPKSFQENTRWTYVEGGVEYGPFSADEILTLVEEKKINPNTSVTELESGRVCPLRDVRPFAQFVAVVMDRDAARKADEELKAEAEKLSGGRRWMIPVLVVAALVLVGGLIALLLNPGLFQPEKKGPIVVHKGGDDPTVNADVVSQDQTATREPELAIAEPESEEEMAREAARKQALETAQQKHVVVPTRDGLKGREEIELEDAPDVPRPVKLGSRRNASDKESSGGSAGAKEPKVVTMDFTMEEDESETRANSAQRRLRKALRKCAANMSRNYDDVDNVTARMKVVLQADGRLKKRSLKLTPSKHVSSVSMCMATALPAIMLPPLAGAADEIIQVTVTAN